MGQRTLTIKKSVARQIASVSLFIESKGMVATAEKFSDDVYDFIEKLTDGIKSYRICTEQQRADSDLNVCYLQEKYTIVFIETEDELTVCEFIPSRLIRW